MLNPKVRCTGLRIGRWLVPPFQAGSGEIVCLHVPPEASSAKEQLTDLLSSGDEPSGLHYGGAVAKVERPMPKRGFLWRWRNPKVVDWLTRFAGVTLEQARVILQRWSIPPDMKIGLIQWNPRTWLALDAALTRGVEIVVLDTTGNDPYGIRVASDLIASQTERPTVIHVCYLCGECLFCSFGAQTITLQAEEETPWIDARKAVRPLT